MGPFILLLLPSLSLASITINIRASPERQNTLVTYVGKDNDIISDLERHFFVLTDDLLKEAVKLHSNETPTDVFVKRPTPWGDLYKTYDWPEVRRETKVKRVDIQSVTRKPVIIAKELYTNKIKKEAMFVTSVRKTVVSRVINNFKGIKQSVDVKHNIILGKGVAPLFHLDFISHLQNNTVLSVIKTMQTRDDIIFNLRPQQSAEVFMNATKVTMQVLVEYVTSLDGVVVANYDPRYIGHHFWAYDVRAVMEAAGKSSVQKATDLIIVEYYTDGKVVLQDAASGTVMQTADAVFVDE